jgi:hypothetical protein
VVCERIDLSRIKRSKKNRLVERTIKDIRKNDRKGGRKKKNTDQRRKKERK